MSTHRIFATISGFLMLLMVSSVALAQTGSTVFLPVISSSSGDEVTMDKDEIVMDSAAPVYFVNAVTGSNNNAGTQTAPWKTIQWAVDHATPGSTINVATGTYCEAVMVNPRISGSASAMTTIQNGSPNPPILDGSCLKVGVDKFGFKVNGASYVTLKGFIIRNYITTASNEEPVGIAIVGNAHDIYLQSNKISKIENRGTDPSKINAYGIKVRTEVNQSISSIFIDGNELSSLVLGNSESLSINGNIDNFWITNNVIRGNDNIGIDAIGFEDNSPNQAPRNGHIVNNEVASINATANPAYHGIPAAVAIYVDGGDSIIVERNKVHESNIGIEVASEHKGHNASNVIVRSNLVYKNMLAGIAIGGGEDNMGGTINCWVVNNTLFDNNTKPLDGPNGELWIQYNTTGNIIENNIIYAGQANMLIASPYPSNNTINFNFYYTTGNPTQRTWLWRDTEYTYADFTTYKDATHDDANSWLDNPKLDLNPASPTFLHLQAGSLAINKGQTLSAPIAGDKDIDGQPRLKSQIDVGADEVQ